ncbi:MAG: DUF1963 domain-containing protein [Clostridia bacterium]|nr:DUF1963 domain-containing protein [Clostridia bacterium]
MKINGTQIDEVIKEIKNRTKQPCYKITVDKITTPDIFDSKFGGLPYWDLTKEYPTDSKGNKLLLLAQINFDKEHLDKPLPSKGMLQFFISSFEFDDCYGVDFDHQDNQDGFRVVYHKKTDTTVTKADIEKLSIPTDEYFPVDRELAVKITPDENYIGLDIVDDIFREIFREIVIEKFGKEYYEDTDENVYEYLEDDDFDKLSEELSSDGHKLLGTPYFTQSDPRPYNERYTRYDTLLFQIDSDGGYNKDDEYHYEIIWGDCGVANFFINRKDLENCDFSKVLFNWDCF